MTPAWKGSPRRATRADIWKNPSVWIVTALIVFGGLLVGLHVHLYTQVSPIDELQHIDYVEKVIRRHLVRRG